MSHRHINRLLSVFLFVSLTLIASAQRDYGGLHTQHNIANARANVSTNAWAAQQRNTAISNAAPWVAISDEDLWSMIPSQSLPRCIDVTWDYNKTPNRLGCVVCGDQIVEYGSYPYEPDFKNKPWKLTCPSCQTVFPTNDFGAYYRSGINQQGLFDPAIANKSLLYNPAYPSPSHPLHKYGVDDGYGYIDTNGRAHKYIGYYTWKYWRYLYSGVNNLSQAYYLTGEKIYARKAAIMLDRIADIYPAMNWNTYANLGWYHSDGGSKQGKIEGRIWETATVQQFARAYDKIISGTINNPGLYTFLQQKDTQFNLPGTKGTRADLIRNIDSGLLETAATAIINKIQIRGNEGMHQSSLALCAVALNTEPKTSQWIDWLFTPAGGKVPELMVNSFDRDGMANEAGPNYCYLWPGKFQEIMDTLEAYPAYTTNRISRDFPWFRNSYRSPWQVQLLNSFDPNIGDSGATGQIKLLSSPNMIATGFKFFNDTTAARYAWEANKNSSSNLLMDIGSPTPDHINDLLEEAALNYPVQPRWGENLAGYGLASFEFGNNVNGKALWCYYGRSTGHGHLDRLNMGLHAFGVDLSPDLGYPEYANATWPSRRLWNNTTISHNTVLINKLQQTGNWTGYPQFYTTGPGFGAVEIESSNAYPGLSQQYARTMAFIELPDKKAYAVDIFRVVGGTDHLMSFHGPPGLVATTGLNLATQATGTYAGPGVPYGDTSTAHPTGYAWLKNVQRQTNPPAAFTLDWKTAVGYRGVKATDNIHLKQHVMTQLTDIALADGIPAPNQPGNPASIRYALLHRQSASTLNSQFVSVLEPWKDSPFIQNTTTMTIQGTHAPEAVALKVESTGGITDYIISNPFAKTIQVINGPATNGVFAWLRINNGRPTSATLTRGTMLTFNGISYSGTGNIAGNLVDFTRDVKTTASVIVNVTQGDPTRSIGSQIIFQNDRVRNACYDILAVEPMGAQWKITCGPASFARGFANTSNYALGYTYNIAPGNTFYIPVTDSFPEPSSQIPVWSQYSR